MPSVSLYPFLHNKLIRFNRSKCGSSYVHFLSICASRHYHSMEVFATFNVYNSSGHRVAEGHKASFCLEDNQCMPDVKPKYACANFGDQGKLEEGKLVINWR